MVIRTTQQSIYPSQAMDPACFGKVPAGVDAQWSEMS